jgi:hypothetical protein
MPIFGSNIDIVDDDFFTEIKDYIRDLQPGDQMYLVTPYIRLDEKIKETLEEAANRGAKLTFLVRKDAERNPKDCEFLANHRLDVYEHKYLHAKIYWTPFVALVTSINLYDFSDRKSREIGVRLTSKKEIQDLKEIIEKWIAKSDRISLATLMNIPVKTEFKVEKSVGTLIEPEKKASFQSVCIRGGEPIPYDRKKPYCPKHYYEWAETKDRRQLEVYCHRCGGKFASSLAEPICEMCRKDIRAV